jgi:hypothetical protein
VLLGIAIVFGLLTRPVTTPPLKPA